MPRALARPIASCTTDPGSAPSVARTISAPLRVAHCSSWSAAAARKVSPAASNAATPLVVLALREFANRRGLAHAIHAHEQPHRDAALLGARPQRAIATEGVDQNGAQRGRHSLGRAVDSQLVQHRLGHGNTHVRTQQHFLDHVQLLGAHLTRARERPHTIKDASRRSQASLEVNILQHRHRRRLGDEHLGHRRPGRGDQRHRSRSPSAATHHHGCPEQHHHYGQYDVEGDHAVSTSFGRFTR
jgi:hypothetical protein